MSSIHVFLYGDDRAHELAGIASERVAEASVPGTLFDVDGVGLALMLAGTEPVRGTVVRMGATDLEVLDARARARWAVPAGGRRGRRDRLLDLGRGTGASAAPRAGAAGRPRDRGGRMKRMRGAVILLAALSAGACEDVVDPNGVAGTYELTAVQGDPLPAVMFDGETQFGHLVATALSGSLTLREASYTERVVVDLVLDGTPLGDDPVIVSGDYSVEGQILSFEPDRADYPGFSGTLEGGVLTTLEVDPQFGELTMRWER